MQDTFDINNEGGNQSPMSLEVAKQQTCDGYAQEFKFKVKKKKKQTPTQVPSEESMKVL
jgi:hypothetical protein